VKAAFFNLKQLDVMGSSNDTLKSFDAGIAHLEAIGDTAHALIPRVCRSTRVRRLSRSGTATKTHCK
jgi:hypothetical protein